MTMAGYWRWLTLFCLVGFGLCLGPDRGGHAEQGDLPE